jgi:galactokinase/galacturonokinase
MTKLDLNNKTILVTGAAGFIGSNLVMRLLRDLHGATIVGIDNMNDYYDVSLKEYRLREIANTNLSNDTNKKISEIGAIRVQKENCNLCSKEKELPFEIGIFFSGLTRSLMSSDYNLRVAECKTAAWLVEAYENIPLREQNKTFLRDVSENMFKIHRDKMPPRFARRAEHFFSEYKRVREGITAWETGNLDWFGSLSKASCESSIHSYECGSPELIAIYNAMLTTDGIYGGRFSGAGFKGACIALVDPAKKEGIEKEITEKYLSQFPQYKNTFRVYFCKSDDGARFI